VNRTVIGRAEGILMERFDLQPAQAFAVLTRLSQHNNIRLHLVAAELVKTRTLPGAEK
jgi:AmiR/NasT family two-component response regulator